MTIGVPVRNGAHHLEGCLRQLLAQTHKNTQILISDNNSTDDTEKIARFWVKKNHKITYFRQPATLNVTQNFNFLFSKAKGKYFMWAAVDDEWNKDFIRLCMTKFRDDPKCVLAFTDFRIKIRETGQAIPISVQSSCAKSPFIRIASRCLDMQPHLIYGLINREKLKQVRLKNIDFFDCLFGLEVAKVGNIRISEIQSFSWCISKKRNSYSIHGNRIQYLPFLRAAMQSVNNLSFIKKLNIFSNLIYFILMKFRQHTK